MRRDLLIKLYDGSTGIVGDGPSAGTSARNRYADNNNQEYLKVYENEENGQIGFLYLLYLVNKYGRAYRDLQFYTDLYFTAFPIFNVEEQKIEGIKYKECELVIQTRFFKRFANWFGFVEIQYEEDKKYFSRSITV